MSFLTVTAASLAALTLASKFPAFSGVPAVAPQRHESQSTPSQDRVLGGNCAPTEASHNDLPRSWREASEDRRTALFLYYSRESGFSQLLFSGSSQISSCICRIGSTQNHGHSPAACSRGRGTWVHLFTCFLLSIKQSIFSYNPFS